MHCSAKRGIAIACRLSIRLSVCLSVTLVDCDHIGWKSRKLIERTNRSAHSLFVAQRPSTYSQGNMGSETRKDRGKVTMDGIGYRNSPTLFRTVSSPTPNDLLFPKIWSSQPPVPTKNSNRYYLRNAWSYGPQLWPEHSQGPSNKSPTKAH